MKTHCALCFHRCELDEGQTGLCRARGCRDGRIVPLNYGKLASLTLDSIEKKPLLLLSPPRPFHWVAAGFSFRWMRRAPAGAGGDLPVIAAAGTAAAAQENILSRPLDNRLYTVYTVYIVYIQYFGAADERRRKPTLRCTETSFLPRGQRGRKTNSIEVYHGHHHQQFRPRAHL